MLLEPATFKPRSEHGHELEGLSGQFYQGQVPQTEQTDLYKHADSFLLSVERAKAAMRVRKDIYGCIKILLT